MTNISEYVNPEIEDVIFLYAPKIVEHHVKSTYIGCIKKDYPYNEYVFIPNDKKVRLQSGELRSIALKIERLQKK